MERLAGIAVVAWIALPAIAHAQAYDAAPLLAHVRESERAGLAERLDVADVSALPLYDLHVAIDDQLRGFGLRETLTYTHAERAPVDEIVLRVYANAVGEGGPQVTLVRGGCLDGRTCEVVAASPATWRVRLDRPLARGEHVRIELDVRGRLRAIDASRTTMMAQGLESLGGMMGEGAPGGAGDYGLLAQSEGVGSLANFFPVLARREGGRWIADDGGSVGDLGTDRMSHVRARIVVPQGMQVVTSGVETGSLPVRDAPGRARRREVTVQAGLVRDFAIVAGALESTSRTVNGTTIRSHYLGRDRETGRVVLDVAASALEIFERRFGAYPYTELDVVEAPLVGGAGGVEFSALVTVASMFYRPAGLGALAGGADAGAMQRSMVEFVTAHEVAHQWWHGIVGSDSRNHPWVDESLAQYSAMLYVEDRYGAARADEEGTRQVAMNYRAMRMMGLPDAAVDRAASAFTAPIAYAGLVYGKGPYVYRALRQELGDEPFFAGLRAYVAAWRYRIAPARGPIDALATGPRARRVRAIARRWLDETHGDEDLGGGDPSEVLGSMLPPELRDQLADPAVQGMLRGLLSGMGGSGGEAGDAAEMMHALEEMLGSLPE